MGYSTDVASPPLPAELGGSAADRDAGGLDERCRNGGGEGSGRFVDCVRSLARPASTSFNEAYINSRTRSRPR